MPVTLLGLYAGPPDRRGCVCDRLTPRPAATWRSDEPATAPAVLGRAAGCSSPGVVIWVAGSFLSNNTDVLADRLHLGQALGGLILLAVATNLPEIAITYSAAASGQLAVAVSNILGGIAIQTVVLVALDAFGVRERRPLTYQAASLTLVIEGAG